MGRDYQLRGSETQHAREIKASAHYTYIVNGITLDGSKFAPQELVLEGQCLVRDTASGKYEKYAGDMEGKDTPVILDESVMFRPIDGENPDVTVGQVLVHGAVYAGMLKNNDETFEAALAGAVRFVRN